MAPPSRAAGCRAHDKAAAPRAAARPHPARDALVVAAAAAAAAAAGAGAGGCGARRAREAGAAAAAGAAGAGVRRGGSGAARRRGRAAQGGVLQDAQDGQLHAGLHRLPLRRAPPPALLLPARRGARAAAQRWRRRRRRRAHDPHRGRGVRGGAQLQGAHRAGPARPAAARGRARALRRGAQPHLRLRHLARPLRPTLPLVPHRPGAGRAAAAAAAAAATAAATTVGRRRLRAADGAARAAAALRQLVQLLPPTRQRRGPVRLLAAPRARPPAPTPQQPQQRRRRRRPRPRANRPCVQPQPARAGVRRAHAGECTTTDREAGDAARQLLLLVVSGVVVDDGPAGELPGLHAGAAAVRHGRGAPSTPAPFVVVVVAGVRSRAEPAARTQILEEWEASLVLMRQQLGWRNEDLLSLTLINATDLHKRWDGRHVEASKQSTHTRVRARRSTSHPTRRRWSSSPSSSCVAAAAATQGGAAELQLYEEDPDFRGALDAATQLDQQLYAFAQQRLEEKKDSFPGCACNPARSQARGARGAAGAGGAAAAHERAAGAELREALPAAAAAAALRCRRWQSPCAQRAVPAALHLVQQRHDHARLGTAPRVHAQGAAPRRGRRRWVMVVALRCAALRCVARTTRRWWAATASRRRRRPRSWRSCTAAQSKRGASANMSRRQRSAKLAAYRHAAPRRAAQRHVARPWCHLRWSAC
eukprot:scaffold2789_cov297-Prasinococcus_capsulatus_cf.AAC.3